MIEIADYQIMLDVLLANQAKIQAEIEQLKADFIKDYSPFQVGDIVREKATLIKSIVLNLYVGLPNLRNENLITENSIGLEVAELSQSGKKTGRRTFASISYFVKVED